MSKPTADSISYADVYFLTVATGAIDHVSYAQEGYTSFALSPDATRFALAHGYVNNSLIDLRLNDSSSHDILIIGGPLNSIDWSPDGEQLIVAIVTGERAVIKTIPVSTLDEVEANDPRLSVATMGKIGEEGIHGSVARWSSDGTQIAYVDESRTGISVINADGSNDRELLNNIPGYVEGLSWSPDGSRLLYSFGSYTAESHILDLSTGADQLAITGGAWADWSPDGRQLAYVAEDANGVPQIHVMDLNGGNIRQLTQNTLRSICLH